MAKLSATQITEVLAIAERAERVDGVYPLGEEARYNLHADLSHHIARIDGVAAAYLQHDPRYGSAQLVVAPEYRRRGLATALLAEVGKVPLWAFQDLPAARALARKLGYLPIRALLILEAEIAGLASAESGPDAEEAGTGEAEHDPPWSENGPNAANPAPSGTRALIRPFSPGDLDALVAANAAAFAHHPEQGKMTAADFRNRMAEEWFDPAGLLLSFEGDSLIGFHWTKRHDARRGEVYVLGVVPTAQGRGQGRALLEAGIRQLRKAGVETVFLYVDEAEEKPVKLYMLAGFKQVHRDVFYAPQEKI
ncbi:MAG: mycothiol synthase [Propionibacteriaceae bacterium]|jgi:mycothiol synthase|nr:mycothiol synthase [Propionibacteriaceae bacterium]